MTSPVATTLTSPIAEGDAGIVIKADGSFQIFTTGTIDPNAMTESQIRQGQILMALATALNTPELLQVLLEASNELNVDAADILDVGATH